MIPFNEIKTIFFDYDGTLHNSMRLYGPAFRKAYNYLVKEGYAEEREWKDDEISIWLGYNPKEMWKNFMPALKEEITAECSSIIGDEMKLMVDKGSPVLYEGALDTLEYLKKSGYRLVFISNCKSAYRDSHSKLFHLVDYFEELACSEEYSYIPKHEILSRIKEKYPESMVIVGDRAQDMEAGRKNGIFTIGCSYGYALEGELDEVDLLIGDIRELKKYF